MKTRSQLLTNIRQACIANDSSILELRAGCRINFGGGIKYQGIIVGVNEVSNPVVWMGLSTKSVRFNQINKIIGRKIGISDVADMILESTNFHLRDECEYEGWDAENPSIGDVLFYLWDLTADDLELQDLPTLTFIDSLLPHPNIK